MPHRAILFGLESPSSVKTIDVSAASQSVLGAAPRRYAITLGAPTTGRITYAPFPITAIGAGINIGQGEPAITLSAEHHGNVMREEWFAFADAANRLAAVIEVFLPEGTPNV